MPNSEDTIFTKSADSVTIPRQLYRILYSSSVRPYRHKLWPRDFKLTKQLAHRIANLCTKVRL